MPDFPSESQVISVPDFAMEDQAAPDSSSKRKPHPVRNPTSGPNPAFAAAEGIGIILHQDWKPQGPFNFRTQRVISHGRKIGRKDYPASLVINLSRNPKANPCDRAAKLAGSDHLSTALGNQPLSSLPNAKGNIGSGPLSP
jgi:hypothetical protein